jgi:RNA polymerase sigma-70 factor (ECF subfamily)
MKAAVLMAETSGDTDLELVERHRYGDRAAFEQIYQRHAEMVFNLAFRMTGDREEAADVSQETFLRVHRYCGRFRGRSSLKTWIYRVTVNCCRSRFRRNQNWRTRILSGALETVEQVPDTRRGPEDRTLARDRGEMVTGALRRLPEPFREAVVLRDLEGLTYEEIANVLGVRIGTVRSRIARGRDRLRTLLEKSESCVTHR